MQFPAVPGLIWFALLLGLSLQAQSQQPFDIQYRFQDDVQRSIDGGQTWDTILRSPGVWLIWDQESPRHICFYAIWADIAAGFSQWVYCSWNAGASWHHHDFEGGLYLTTLKQMSSFARNLRVDPADDDALLLTTNDRIFRLHRLEERGLSVETIETLPIPATCTGLPEDQICANQALNGLAAVWYDPVQSGQALTIVGRQGSFWGYYTAYDDLGNSHWYLFQFSPTYWESTISHNRYPLELVEFNGPPLGTEWDPTLVQDTTVANASIKFISPWQIIFTHYDLGPEEVTLNLVPFQ